MTVKSWINSPSAEDGPTSGQIKAGMVQIQGVAFGGLHAVKGVEVSLDGGKTWQTARLVGPDLGKYAWRQFVLQARLSPGNYTMASRATDIAGNVQPQTRGENLSGYNNTSWMDHAVKINVV
jgi:sulfite dehydrogenase